MLCLSHSLGRAQLRDWKHVVTARTWKVPELKAVARQHLSLEVLSEAQQHWGSVLL